MADYIAKTIERIMKTFADCDVVLVEVSSVLPEYNGNLYAITQNTGGYTPLNDIIIQGCFERDKTATFGVTIRSINAMESIKNCVPVSHSAEEIKMSPFQYWASLALFLIMLSFIIGCIWGMFK